MAARRLRNTDVVIIGLGWTGSILAQELTDAGLNVVAIERGPWRDTASNFPTTYAQDELRYHIRHDLFLRPAQQTMTFRHNVNQMALPIRTWGSFMPPNGVGGGGVHWNAETWRFLPTDFQLRSHLTQRYGVNNLPQDMTIQDWGVSYDELEPHYDKFEYLCGTSGTAGNIKGENKSGGNPFEGGTLAGLSDAGAEAAIRSGAMGEGGGRHGLSPVSAALRQSVSGLYKSARGDTGAVHVLWILRMVRVRELFEGEPADDAAACPGAQAQLRGADIVHRHAHQPR